MKLTQPYIQAEEARHVLDLIPMELRSVAAWNVAREELKQRYPQEVINIIDQSGYIIRWLGKTRRYYRHFAIRT